jgi:FdrA protein
MPGQLIIRKNEYHDSIQLMRISENLRKMEGVEQLMVIMATPSNKQILNSIGFSSDALNAAGKNDMVIAFRTVHEKMINEVLAAMESLFRQGEAKKKEQRTHHSIESALRFMPDAGLCQISLPGEHAFSAAKKALESGLHVIIYSDNVPLEEERALKELAEERGLLCMGPDCGVVNINGIAFLTASVVKKGPVGIVGASGSGTQLIAALVDRQGLGVSQAIGVGGKDLSDEVGGIGMLAGIDALANDPETEVIVLVSRTPGEKTLLKILEKVRDSKKPVVVYFIDCKAEIIEKHGGISASDLEEAALKAVSLIKNEPYRKSDFTLNEKEISRILDQEINGMCSNQKYIKGLFCGGTFCDEAIAQLKTIIGRVHSNTPGRDTLRLADVFISEKHSVIDLGDEELTLGRPHPVIDPEPVRQAIIREGKKEETAILLLDFILGPAINPDPAGSVIAQIKEVKEYHRNAGGYLSVVASICGTDGDPQNLTRQTLLLEEAGVVVMPSNVQAARLAGLIAKKLSSKE